MIDNISSIAHAQTETTNLSTDYEVIWNVFLKLDQAGALGDKDEKRGDGGVEEDAEEAEAKREEEERRKEKYRRIEGDRESMRQDIREKVNIERSRFYTVVRNKMTR